MLLPSLGEIGWFRAHAMQNRAGQGLAEQGGIDEVQIEAVFDHEDTSGQSEENFGDSDGFVVERDGAEVSF